MQNYYPPLIAGNFYHIYNRGNNRENLFYSERNYLYFIKKYDSYLSASLETYAYCLLPNHFHLLVRVKDIVSDSIRDSIARSDGIPIIPISEQFRRFFIGYSQAINKQEGRAGSLLSKNFKRVVVESGPQLLYLVYYIHANPQNHGLVQDFRRYPYSSYSAILSDRPTRLRRDEVLKWFGGAQEFMDFHRGIQETKSIMSLIIEDD